MSATFVDWDLGGELDSKAAKAHEMAHQAREELARYDSIAGQHRENGTQPLPPFWSIFAIGRTRVAYFERQCSRICEEIARRKEEQRRGLKRLMRESGEYIEFKNKLESDRAAAERRNKGKAGIKIRGR